MRKWLAMGAWMALACSPVWAQGPKQPVPKVPVVELFGGYAFARFDTGGSATNGNGLMGSFGWNAKRWLQIVADTSYNTGTTNGVKNVLYGNHFGPRLFYRSRNRLGLTPFAEFLVGGSDVTTTVGGTLQTSEGRKQKAIYGAFPWPRRNSSRSMPAPPPMAPSALLSVGWMRPRQRTRTGPASVISLGSVRRISTGEPALTSLGRRNRRR